MRRIIAVLSLLTIVIVGSAQERGSDNIIDMAHEMITDMVSDGIISNEASADVAEIANILSNPVDINNATPEELNAMLVLTEKQINGILNYRKFNKEFKVIQELAFVDGFDFTTAYILSKLFRIGYVDTSRRILKNEFVGRVQFSVPKQRGYFPKNDSTPPAFIGKPFKLLIRNKAEYKHWRVGFTAEKDAGEPMFSNGITLTDFTSAFVEYNNPTAKLRQVVVGHYSAQYGEGLGLWTGFAPSTSSVETSVSRRYTRLRSSMSANESDYLRGVGISLNTKPIRTDIFFSHTDVDASVVTTKDSLSTDYITTIQNDGYHRTWSELSGRHNMSQILAGAYIDYSRNNIMIGVGSNYWHGSMPLGKKEALYQLFRPQTDNITTLHANYRYYNHVVTLYGEVAWQSTNTFAGTHGVDIALNNDITFTIAMRKFGRRYYCIKQNPNSRASQPGGETGFTLGVSANPFSYLSLLANVDIYRNSWLAYQKPFPHAGYKTTLKTKLIINNDNDLTLRLRFEEYDGASKADKAVQATFRKTHVRLQWECRPITPLKLRTTLEKSRFTEIGGKTSEGFWIGQEIRLTLDNPRCGAALLLAHFDTDDYDSRIYATVPDVPYSMSLPAYNNRGFTVVGRLQWSPNRWLRLWTMINHIRYSNIEQISSGNNLIDAPDKTEIKIQMLLKPSYFFKSAHTMKKAEEI